MDKPKTAYFSRALYLDDLRPGDILVFEDQARGLWGAVKRWALGATYGYSWGHVSVYAGAGEQIESVGRGASQTTLQPGRLTAVLRHSCYNADMGARLLAEARKIRDSGGAWYDYGCIPRYVIPRLLFHKLTGGRFGFGWRRNSIFICSELGEEVYFKSGYQLWDNLDVPPLPDDFFYNNPLILLGLTRFRPPG